METAFVVNVLNRHDEHAHHDLSLSPKQPDSSTSSLFFITQDYL